MNCASFSFHCVVISKYVQVNFLQIIVRLEFPSIILAAMLFMGTKPRKFCSFELGKGSREEICGKLQIYSHYKIEHYGLVLELQCRVTLVDEESFRGKVTKPLSPNHGIYSSGIFQPSQSVVKSRVYTIVSGCPEALRVGPVPKRYRKTLHGGSYFHDFSLKLPYGENLPPSFTTQFCDVRYDLVLYKRTQLGYEPVGEKTFKFHGIQYLTQSGLNGRSDTDCDAQTTSQEPSARVDLPKLSFMRGGSIPYIVHVLNPNSSLFTATKIIVSLLKREKYTFKRDIWCTAVVAKKEFKSPPSSIYGNFSCENCPTLSYVGVDALRITYHLRATLTWNKLGGDGSSSTFSSVIEKPIIVGCLVYDSARRQNFVEEEALLPQQQQASSESAGGRLPLRQSPSFPSFPPSYSQLSSRVPSLETLPPHYDDLEM